MVQQSRNRWPIWATWPATIQERVWRKIWQAWSRWESLFHREKRWKQDRLNRTLLEGSFNWNRIFCTSQWKRQRLLHGSCPDYGWLPIPFKRHSSCSSPHSHGKQGFSKSFRKIRLQERGDSQERHIHQRRMERQLHIQHSQGRMERTKNTDKNHLEYWDKNSASGWFALKTVIAFSVNPRKLDWKISLDYLNHFSEYSIIGSGGFLTSFSSSTKKRRMELTSAFAPRLA